MVYATQIDAVGSDGHHVGHVDHVLGDTIELAELESVGGFQHHLISFSWASRIEEKKVFLSKTAEEAKAEWREKPSN